MNSLSIHRIQSIVSFVCIDVVDVFEILQPAGSNVCDNRMGKLHWMYKKIRLGVGGRGAACVLLSSAVWHPQLANLPVARHHLAVLGVRQRVPGHKDGEESVKQGDPEFTA